MIDLYAIFEAEDSTSFADFNLAQENLLTGPEKLFLEGSQPLRVSAPSLSRVSAVAFRVHENHTAV